MSIAPPPPKVSVAPPVSWSSCSEETQVIPLPPFLLPGLSLPVSVVSSSSSSSSSVAGHMMYPGSHTVMYTTPPSSLGDGSSLAVLNAFPAAGHSQSQDPGTTINGSGFWVRPGLSAHLFVVLLCSCGAAGLPHISFFSRCTDPRFCSPAAPGTSDLLLIPTGSPPDLCFQNESLQNHPGSFHNKSFQIISSHSKIFPELIIL